MTTSMDNVRHILERAQSMGPTGEPLQTGSKDGVWVVGVDSERGNYRKYSGKCAAFRVAGGEISKLSGWFDFSSHPGQIRTEASGTPDVNTDGKRDVAWALEGVIYSFKGRRSSSGRFDPTTAQQPVLRNIEGQETYYDVFQAHPKVYPATAIQLHAGTSHKPGSVGCFTLPPGPYANLAEVIEAQRVPGFRLVFELTETYDD